MYIETRKIGFPEKVVGYYDPLRGIFANEPSDENPSKIEITQGFDEIELYLELTETCNLRCSGCAVGVDRLSRRSAATMTSEQLDLILTGVFQSAKNHGKNRIKIKYAGGEPTLPFAWRLIEEAQKIISALRSQNPDLEVSQVILTNGVLLSSDHIRQIKDWEMYVSVSLWGLDVRNDSMRGMKTGFGSAERVLESIRLLVESDVSFNINHVISPENAPNLVGFVSQFWDIGSESFVGRNWIFPNGKRPLPIAFQFFRPQTDLQIEYVNTTEGIASMVEGLKQMFEFAILLTRQGIEIPGLQKIDYLRPFDGVTALTCGSGFNYIAAGPKGVAPCHEDLFQMTDNTGDLVEGKDILDIANASLRIDRSELVAVNREYRDIDPSLVLPLALHGGGGCPRAGDVSNSFTQKIYAEILPTYLAFEAERRKLKGVTLN